MGNFFRKLFSIYPGEERNAARFALLGYLWMVAAATGVKFGDVLFLIHVGAEQLPTVYALGACGMITLATFWMYAFNRLSSYTITAGVIVAEILFYAVVLVIVMLDIGHGADWVWYSLGIFGYLFFVLVHTCFWIFVDQYFHIRDAKRLYGLFGSAMFLGIASTGVVMRLGVLDLSHVIMFVLVLLFVVLWIFRQTNTKLKPVTDESEVVADEGQPGGSVLAFIKGVISSPFVILLMMHNFLVELFTWSTEYTYLSYFQAMFAPKGVVFDGPDTESPLAIFLGQLLIIVGISNLIFAMFFFSRLVRRFGIYSLMIVSAATLFFTFSNWLFSDWILWPIMGFLVVEGTIGVIEGNSFNLLMNGVPSHLKYKVRILTEHFFEPVAKLTSGLLIGWLHVDSKLLTLFLSTCALVVAFLIRRTYLIALVKNLSANAIRFHRVAKDWLVGSRSKEQKATEHRLLAIYRHGDDGAKLFATEALLDLQDASVIPHLMRYVNELTPVAKVTWLDMVGKSRFASDPLVLDVLHRWVRDEDDMHLLATAQFYLAKMGLLHPERAIDDLNNGNLLLKGSAILALKKADRALAAAELQKLLTSDDEAEICMGLRVVGADATQSDIDILLPFIKDASPVVARTAMASIADIASPRSRLYAKTLIGQLAFTSDADFRTHCLHALGRMPDVNLVRDIVGATLHFRPNERRLAIDVLCKVGLRAVPTLLALTQDPSQPYRCRLLAGQVLGRLAPAQLQANLHSIVEREIERAYFYLYHHHTLQQRYPNFDLRELGGALLTGYHSVIDFIIQLLGIVGEAEDCELLSRCMRGRSARIRSQVVEALEKTCDPGIFTLLQPLVDELPLYERLAPCPPHVSALHLEDVLDRMMRSPALSDRIIAATMKYRLDLPNWRTGLRQQMTTGEELFHHFAYELLES